MSEESGPRSPEPDKPPTWVDALLMFATFAGFALVVVAGAHGCAVVAAAANRENAPIDQAARITAAACLRDGNRRFMCVEACRQSPNQISCIDEINKLAPMWRPSPGENQ